jgi:hypothetical protein
MNVILQDDDWIGCIDPRDYPPEKLLKGPIAEMNSWECLVEIWFRLYRTLGTCRDQLKGELDRDWYESFGSVDAKYIEDKFELFEKLVEDLRKKLSPSERPYLEIHLNVVSSAIQYYKAPCYKVARAIDEFLLLGDTMWQKSIHAAYAEQAKSELSSLRRTKMKKVKKSSQMNKAEWVKMIKYNHERMFQEEMTDLEVERDWWREELRRKLKRTPVADEWMVRAAFDEECHRRFPEDVKE